MKDIKTKPQTTTKSVKNAPKSVEHSAKQAAKQAKEVAQKSAQAAKATAKAAVKITVKVAQMVAAVAKAVVSALAALGGWAVLLVALIIVIVVAAIAASPFGIFISDEAADNDSIPISAIVAECNMELSNKLDDIENAAARLSANRQIGTWYSPYLQQRLQALKMTLFKMLSLLRRIKNKSSRMCFGICTR